jgi:hypothetical protein
MLFSIETIRKEFDEEFLALERDIDGLRLIPGGLVPDQVRRLEERLCVTFPSDFVELVCAFDFGNLTLGPVQFCGSGDYSSQLIELNEQDEWGNQWWEGKVRPDGTVMIANSDPFAFVLDTTSGGVLGFIHEEGWAQAQRIAANFALYVRGLGTAMRHCWSGTYTASLATQISEAVGAESHRFWRHLVF